MKGFVLKTAALVTAVLLVMTALPALAGEARDLPASFNAHDVSELRAFFEIEDENGVKNGEKLFPIYDADDPTTWIGTAELHPGWGDFEDMVRWNEDGSVLGLILTSHDLVGSFRLDGTESIEFICLDDNRISEIELANCPHVSTLQASSNEIAGLNFDESVDGFALLDLSHNRIEELDLSGMDGISFLRVGYNKLTSLDMTGIMFLEDVDCSHNELTELKLSDVWTPEAIDASFNRLTEIDFSAVHAVGWMDLSGNPFTSLDISGLSAGRFVIDDCPLSFLKLKCSGSTVELHTDGHGYLGADLDEKPVGEGSSGYVMTLTLRASAFGGYDFDAWYDENGAWAYFYEEQDIPADEVTDMILTAVFEPNGEPIEPPPTVPGDVNGDGSVNVTDALTVLRSAMGLVQLGENALEAADFNGDGSVTLSDALLILRFAMGLI